MTQPDTASRAAEVDPEARARITAWVEAPEIASSLASSQAGFTAVEGEDRSTTDETNRAVEDNRTDEDNGADALLRVVYDELRSLARAYLARERPGHTLQATALVHEAFLRLVDQSRVTWKGRGHFFAVGARMMRRVLVDHARRRGSHKRGGDWHRVTLVDAPIDRPLASEELLALHAAIERLAELDPRQAQVVELRFFAGFPSTEVARLLDVSTRTVEGDWTHARAWLRRALAQAGT